MPWVVHLQIESAPDRKYITNLKDVYFPGTVIAIKFPLQIKHNTLEVEK
jgi:hypothetical protein